MQHFENVPMFMITVGPPGSGKTMFSTRLAVRGVKHLSRDKVRNDIGKYSREKEIEVLRVMEGYAKGWLLDGKDVVVDANHVTVEQRGEIMGWSVGLWRAYGFPLCKVALFFPPGPGGLETCLERKKEKIQDPNDDLTEDVVKSQYHKLVPPTPKEGFNVFYIDAVSTDPEHVLMERAIFPHRNEDFR
jgi:predicted kinase